MNDPLPTPPTSSLTIAPPVEAPAAEPPPPVVEAAPVQRPPFHRWIVYAVLAALLLLGWALEVTGHLVWQ